MMMSGKQILAQEIADKTMQIASLVDQVELLRAKYQSVVAVLTAKQKEKLGLDS